MTVTTARATKARKPTKAQPAKAQPAGSREPASKGPPEASTKGQQTRRAILDAAIGRFGRDGYRGTSVADIAREAGVSGTLVYAYFANKEALFLAAVDEDAGAVIDEGASGFIDDPVHSDWTGTLMLSLLAAVQHHPLTERLLAGLEPEVTDRVLEIPALHALRRVCAARLAAEQEKGTVRPDIDPVAAANGVVTIVLSLLMSAVRFGGRATLTYGPDVALVLESALHRRPPEAS